jgi:hypothetical protein
MNRKLTTTITIAAALLSLSACNVVDTVNQLSPSDTPAEVDYSDPVVKLEGSVALATTTPCEGADCPPATTIVYPPCVTEGANNQCSGEGANS